MDDLIEALTIFRKYRNTNFPTNCEHDVLHVDVDPELVDQADTLRLDELGFFPSSEHSDGFDSFRFGSC